jgi:hypothetical protein
VKTLAFLGSFAPAVIIVGLACGGILRAQVPLQVTGQPQWLIQDGTCKFTLSGETKIINPGPPDYLSGSLRFVLWMTASPFPNPGYQVSVVDLGQLPGGNGFADASTSAPVVIPKVTGFQFFTLALEEYLGPGFVTHFAGGSTLKYLRQGVAGLPPLWKPPTGRVIPVPVSKPAGMKVELLQKGIQSGGKAYVIPKFDQYSISAKLGRSGRTVIYGGSRQNGIGGNWSFKSGNAKWGGKSHRVGVLTFDHGVIQGKRVKSTYWLFFQKNGRGFFKGTHADVSQTFTNWGLFTLG